MSAPAARRLLEAIEESRSALRSFVSAHGDEAEPDPFALACVMGPVRAIASASAELVEIDRVAWDRLLWTPAPATTPSEVAEEEED